MVECLFTDLFVVGLSLVASFQLQILCLFRGRSSFDFSQLQSVDLL